MRTVSQIRNTVIPEELYELVFAYAAGDYTDIAITTLDQFGNIGRHKFSKESNKPSGTAEIKHLRIVT